MTTHLVKAEQQPLAPASDPADLLDVVARACMSPDVDPAKMREVLAMRRELEAEKAQRLFNQAMSGFQRECPTIVKTKGVPDRTGKVAFKFAPIEDVESVIRPLEAKYGFRHTFPDMVNDNGRITQSCRIKHDAGHFEDAKVTYRLSTKTSLMSDSQQDASTETFAKRRALCNGYGLVIVGEDFDGASKAPKPISSVTATEKTRAWMLSQLADIREKAHAYAIDQGWVMPDEGIDTWDLSKIPITKTALAELRKKIEAMP